MALAALPAAQPQEVPRFMSGVDVVQFTVTVLDKERRPVTGLTAADFDVLVDGKPRPLMAFAAVTLPDDTLALRESLPSVPVDVQTNRLPLEGRLVVIVMDRSIFDEDRQAAHAIANAAIDRLGPNDIGAVVYTGHASRKYSQGLTTDRARLHAAANLANVSDMQAAPGTPSLAAAIASRGAPQKVDQLERSLPLASEEQSGECDCGVCVIDSLTVLARSLTGAMGRQKSILYVGSDIAIASQIARTDIRDFGGRCSAYIYPARDTLTRALHTASVTFHVIDPHGLDPLEGISFRKQSLAVLPDETGGRTVINNNRPEEKIGSIFDESHSYYVLAVARDAAGAVGADQHQIKISVKKSGAMVRTQNLPFDADPAAGRERAPNAAAGALAELLPRADFPLQMNLAPQFSPDGSADVRVLLGVNSGTAGKLDVLIRAYDRVFTPVGAPVKQRLDVPPRAVAGSSAFQWTSGLKLPPGDYEVRAAVATADGTHAASVIGYVDVPDTRKADLALSGIILKSGGQPTLRRVFAAGESIAASFQVARAKAADVSVGYRLTNILGQAFSDGVLPRAASGAGAIEPHELLIRVPNVAGQYVLTITANDGHHSARRDVPLTIR